MMKPVPFASETFAAAIQGLQKKALSSEALHRMVKRNRSAQYSIELLKGEQPVHPINRMTWEPYKLTPQKFTGSTGMLRSWKVLLPDIAARQVLNTWNPGEKTIPTSSFMGWDHKADYKPWTSNISTISGDQQHQQRSKTRTARSVRSNQTYSGWKSMTRNIHWTSINTGTERIERCGKTGLKRFTSFLLPSALRTYQTWKPLNDQDKIG